MLNKIITALGGKKFVVTIVGILSAIIVAALRDKLELSEDQVTNLIFAILGVIGIYDIGQGVADGLSGGLTSHVKGTPTVETTEPPKKK